MFKHYGTGSSWAEPPSRGGVAVTWASLARTTPKGATGPGRGLGWAPECFPPLGHPGLRLWAQAWALGVRPGTHFLREWEATRPPLVTGKGVPSGPSHGLVLHSERACGIQPLPDLGPGTG